MSDRTILRHAVFLAGPTSVGKSDLALALARKYRGEIVCADAFQLYREFPVLSAQPSAREQSLVPHHLFGTVPCREDMDAAQRSRSETNSMLAEIRDDIKALISKVGK